MSEIQELEQPVIMEEVPKEETGLVFLNLQTIDFLTFPWDFPDNHFDEVAIVNCLEFVPGKERGIFMNELYRVLKPEAKAAIVIPRWNSDMSYHDYRYEWPPLSEQSFLIFVKEWRKTNKALITPNDKLKLDLTCDFDFSYGYTFEKETEERNMETKSFWLKRYMNTTDAIHVLLTKRKIQIEEHSSNIRD